MDEIEHLSFEQCLYRIESVKEENEFCEESLHKAYCHRCDGTARVNVIFGPFAEVIICSNLVQRWLPSHEVRPSEQDRRAFVDGTWLWNAKKDEPTPEWLWLSTFMYPGTEYDAAKAKLVKQRIIDVASTELVHDEDDESDEDD